MRSNENSCVSKTHRPKEWSTGHADRISTRYPHRSITLTFSSLFPNRPAVSVILAPTSRTTGSERESPIRNQKPRAAGFLTMCHGYRRRTAAVCLGNTVPSSKYL